MEAAPESPPRQPPRKFLFISYKGLIGDIAWRVIRELQDSDSLRTRVIDMAWKAPWNMAAEPCRTMRESPTTATVA